MTSPLEERNAFKLQWAEKCKSEVVEKKHRIRDMTNEESLDGTFMSFDKIVSEEGGSTNRMNITAALNYAKECIRKGKRLGEAQPFHPPT